MAKPIKEMDAEELFDAANDPVPLRAGKCQAKSGKELASMAGDLKWRRPHPRGVSKDEHLRRKLAKKPFLDFSKK